MSRTSRPLHGRIAVVAGATRGAGRGIARGLGEAGATVYCTGRSVPGDPSPYNRLETIDQTAALVTQAGGTGIALRVDHGSEAEVKALFERIDREQGRLDVLACCVAGEDPLMAGWDPFWKTDLSRGLDVMRQGILSHLLTARHAAPLMIRRKRGLIVEVTEGDFLIGGAGGNVLKDLVKHATKGMALRMAEELRPSRIAVLAITPGYLRSESMLERFGVTEANWRVGARKDANFLASESPLFIGRAVAALAGDRGVLARSGDVVGSWELAREFGFCDEDGQQPDWGRHFARQVVPSMSWMRTGLERHAALLDRALRRTMGYLGEPAAARARRPRVG